MTQKVHFQSKDINTDYFNLRVYVKIKDKNLPLKVYIEGDGFAWIDRHTLSSNPTPVNPVALKLATMDTYENIAYIARPCQYITNKNCTKEYWSHKRFSKEVIQSINQAVSILKKQTKSNQIKLVGFSGGGAIAALLAAKRDDVKDIVTIAGNLNHELLNKHHNTSPMSGSLNPVDIASSISHIKQIHYIGGKDTIIPRKIAYSFKEASINFTNIQIIDIPNATHLNGWKVIFKNNNK